MKQQYNITDKILLLDNGDFRIHNMQKDAIVFIDKKYTWFNLSLLQLQKQQIQRVFEKFYILNDKKNTSKHALVYDAIHIAYNDIIDKDRNLENNKILCDLLYERYNKQINIIVDFGCGTGFSPAYCNKYTSKTIGIDASINMINIAKKNGFDEVYTPSQFSLQNIEVDCVLASYVFHLLDDPQKVLLDLTKKVKYGGIICGNFFKNTHIKIIQDFFKNLNWYQEEMKIKSNYAHGKILIFKKPITSAPFFNVDLLLKSNHFFINSQRNRNIFTSLIEYNILPTFETIDEKYILSDDFEIFINSFTNTTDKNKITKEFKTNTLYLNPDTYIKFNNSKDVIYHINSIVKNTIWFLNSDNEKNEKNESSDINSDVKFYSNLNNIHLELEKKLKFTNSIIVNNKYELTSMKTYMGTKKNLASFIINIISEFSDNNTKIIDLMSGTGIIAAHASNYWKTYASDLQSYSLVLAESQGKGFNTSSKDLIEFLKPYIKENFTALQNDNIDTINKEKAYLNSKVLINILEEYKMFISSTPYYSTKNKGSSLNEKIDKRKKNNKLFPYSLFTDYFSNHYLGMSQSMEVDSIRYAIEQISDEKIKTFALSALIGSLSQFVSSYGGHVAQPKYTIKSINKDNIYRVINERSQTIIFDFFARLSEFEKLSATKKFPIQAIQGPWKNALTTLNKKLDDNTIVYFDPPYTRDEFGRYYHLYETLVKYNYPDSIGIGRTPDKKKGERLNTEFASRNNKNIEDAIVNVISNILDNNWICLWSYANNSVVKMIPVIQRIYDTYNKKINIYSYATEHRHSTQGKKPKNKIIEYVIVFKKAT